MVRRLPACCGKKLPPRIRWLARWPRPEGSREARRRPSRSTAARSKKSPRTWRNAGGSEALFIVEKNVEDELALRPKDLFGLQEFRDLFSEESLSATVSVDVGIQVVMFVDVVGSSAPYLREGNARALTIMRAFFTLAHDIALKRNGAIIKTLGDAVLMSFANPLESFKAALQFVSALDGRNAELPIQVRITVHSGPCVAVNLNTAIDYFGTTVNVVAKLQKAVDAGQIALTDDIMTDAPLREFLRSHGYAFKAPQSIDLPGIGPVDYWKLAIKQRRAAGE